MVIEWLLLSIVTIALLPRWYGTFSTSDATNNIDFKMKQLLCFSKCIDSLNQGIGRAISWLILLAVVISVGNALARYVLNDSSNAWLELQWVLVSAVFLLCAGFTLLHQQHVKVDLLYSRWSRRTQLWIDVFGTVFFLLPMAALVAWLSWPVFVAAFNSGEVSGNSGGLALWWARLLVPIGFSLLLLQGVSECIKRFGILTGHLPDHLSIADNNNTSAT